MITGLFGCILVMLILAQELLTVLQVSTTGNRHLLNPPGLVIPVALLRLPDVPPHVRHLLMANEGLVSKLTGPSKIQLKMGGYLRGRLELPACPLMETGW